MTETQVPKIPGDDETYDQLREKIKSKMEVAKLLGAFLTAVVGGILALKPETTEFVQGTPDWRAGIFFVGLLFIVVAIILFFTTVIAYDRLLMPLRYWEHEPRTERAVQQLMVRASDRYFVPASACFAVGFTLLAYALLQPNLCAFLAIVVTCALLAFGLWYDAKVPKFNYKD